MNLFRYEFKSLATKITLSIGVVFAVMILTLSLLYSLQTISTVDYYVSETEKVFTFDKQREDKIRKITDTIATFLSGHKPEELSAEFNKIITDYKSEIKEHLVVLYDMNGDVIAASSLLPGGGRVTQAGAIFIFKASGKNEIEIVEDGLQKTQVFLNGRAIANLIVFGAGPRFGERLTAGIETDLIQYFVLLTGTFLFFGLLVIRWVILKHIDRLEVLKTATLRLRNGDFPKEIPVNGQDEIADLTRHFNDVFHMLKSQEKFRKQMLGDVAHELRTPLTNLSGKLAAIEDGLVESNQETIGKLNLDIQHLINLTEDLQVLSLANSGALKIYPEVTDLHIETQIANDSFEQSHKNLSFDLVNLVEKNLEVYTDKKRFRQILSNLIDNALKNATAHVRVTISSVKRDRDIEIKVTDNGRGIPQEKLVNVFKRHFRVQDQKTKLPDLEDERNFGFGLGLSIVRQLVILQGARIDVESTSGCTEFTIWFPRHTTMKKVEE